MVAKTDTPLVSIIAVCYNQAPFVTETLDSILAQTYIPIQLIIADDGSTDNSKEIIQAWIKAKAPATLFINHKNNLGLTRNINSALPFVQGAYFQVFGCDDIMLPHKINSQVTFLEQNRDIAIVYSDMQMMDQFNNSLGHTYYEKLTYKKPLSGFIYDAMIERILVAAPTVLIRTSILQQVGMYNEQMDYEDYDFFLRASKHICFLYSPEVTVHYRVLENSLSNSNTRPLKYFRNLFTVFYDNYDTRKVYRKKFDDRLLFCIKNLYSLRYKDAFLLFSKAILKTKDIRLLKYTVASIPLLWAGKKV